MSVALLRSFLEVWRQRSISRAAVELGLTQPSVSQQIASLEAIFERKLFIRHPRGVEPTPLAEELALRIGDSLDQLENLFAETRARSSRLAGTIHLGGPSDILSDLVGPRLRTLTDNNLSLRFTPTLGEPAVQQLLNGEIDFAFGVIAAEKDSKIGSARLGSEELLLVVPHAMLQQFTEPDKLASVLSRTPFIAYDLARYLIHQWLDHNELDLGRVEECATAPDLRFLRNLIISGFGWSVLPRYLVARELGHGDIAFVEGPKGNPRIDYSMFWLKSTLRSPRIAMAHKMILDQFGSQPG